MAERTVAVIGGGPSGLSAAKHLKEEGFRPVLFEQSQSIGGQWNGGAPHSGVWPSMRTNTSRVMTCFSDFPQHDGLAVFPANQQVLDYLRRYADHFGISEHVRLNTRLTGLSRDAGVWKLEWRNGNGRTATEGFSHVVVATGRYNKPHIPAIRGLERFRGSVSHTFQYRDNGPFRGKRVLVLGNSISGLEVSTELASDANIGVISSCRKPRYVVSKIISGVPADCVLFTRFGALSERISPRPQTAERLKRIIVGNFGNPAQFGGLRPSEDIFEAGVALSQYYLAYVAEGRILPKRCAVEFTEDAAIFEDGSREQIDDVIFATGFDLNLPFLSPDIAQFLNAGAKHIDLYKHTFHPELPNLAFVGLYSQIGPFFPVVELQGRWVAMVWSGVRPLAFRDAMLAGIGEFQQWRKHNEQVLCHHMALQFSAEAAVEPDIASRPELAKALLFGPLAPVQFRINGHGSLPDAAARFARTAAEFDCIRSPQLEEDQVRALRAYARASQAETWIQTLVSPEGGLAAAAAEAD